MANCHEKCGKTLGPQWIRVHPKTHLICHQANNFTCPETHTHTLSLSRSSFIVTLVSLLLSIAQNIILLILYLSGGEFPTFFFISFNNYCCIALVCWPFMPYELSTLFSLNIYWVARNYILKMSDWPYNNSHSYVLILIVWSYLGCLVQCNFERSFGWLLSICLFDYDFFFFL